MQAGCLTRPTLPPGGRKSRFTMIVSGRGTNRATPVGTHEATSHTVIAIRPISASEIRYAIIGFSLEIECAA